MACQKCNQRERINENSGCGHAICDNCWRAYLRDKFRYEMVGCPLDECFFVCRLSLLPVTSYERLLSEKDYEEFLSPPAMKLGIQIDDQRLEELSDRPRMNKISDRIFAGGEMCGSFCKQLRIAGITHIVNLSKSIKPHFPKFFTYETVNVDDMESVENGVKFAMISRNKGKVLVCGKESERFIFGMAYLIVNNLMNVREAHQTLNKGGIRGSARPDIQLFKSIHASTKQSSDANSADIEKEEEYEGEEDEESDSRDSNSASCITGMDTFIEEDLPRTDRPLVAKKEEYPMSEIRKKEEKKTKEEGGEEVEEETFHTVEPTVRYRCKKHGGKNYTGLNSKNPNQSRVMSSFWKFLACMTCTNINVDE